jgi:hypothetical protein
LDRNCMEGLRIAGRTGEVPGNRDSHTGCMAAGFFEQELLGSWEWEDAIMLWNAHDG